jgi:hypothetical protein
MNADEQNQKVERGRKASLIYTEIAARSTEQQETIINRLTTAYVAGTLSDNDLRIGFGEIVGIRKMLTSMQTEIRLGRSAAEQEMKNVNVS